VGIEFVCSMHYYLLLDINNQFLFLGTLLLYLPNHFNVRLILPQQPIG
jgi:hypothetical protein